MLHISVLVMDKLKITAGEGAALRRVVGVAHFNTSHGQTQNNCVCLFSSPEHEVLMVSYCDQSMSVVRRPSSVVRRPSSTICFKRVGRKILRNRLN